MAVWPTKHWRQGWALQPVPRNQLLPYSAQGYSLTSRIGWVSRQWTALPFSSFTPGSSCLSVDVLAIKLTRVHYKTCVLQTRTHMTYSCQRKYPLHTPTSLVLMMEGTLSIGSFLPQTWRASQIWRWLHLQWRSPEPTLCLWWRGHMTRRWTGTTNDVLNETSPYSTHSSTTVYTNVNGSLAT